MHTWVCTYSCNTCNRSFMHALMHLNVYVCIRTCMYSYIGMHIQLRIKAKNKKTGETREGILNMVDLAGSERLGTDHQVRCDYALIPLSAAIFPIGHSYDDSNLNSGLSGLLVHVLIWLKPCHVHSPAARLEDIVPVNVRGSTRPAAREVAHVGCKLHLV